MKTIRTKSGALKIFLLAILLAAPIMTATLIPSQNQGANMFIYQTPSPNRSIDAKKEIILYTVELAFPYLSFDHPVGIYNAGDGTNRLFVLEQRGVIYVFNNSENTTTAKVFLNITDKVISGGELGLLGLVFHPNYAVNGYFYVDYTADNPLRTVIARYTVNQSDPDQANKTSEQIILEVLQPFTNHNGGQLAFGPRDGYLYIALGDGGSAGDPLGNAQNRSTLLGKILRINIDSASPPLNYSIPTDNPFFNYAQGYWKEIYAYGLRNPWRFSFDNVTGWLWAGDVGQDSWEEIDIIESGKNYGWNIMEGNHSYPPSSNLNTTGLELPIWEYGHNVGDSITGGFVYRGSALPELNGSYIYGDFEHGQIWTLNYDRVNPTTNTLLVDTNLLITSFGIDENNELYIVDYRGQIYQLNYFTLSIEAIFSVFYALEIMRTGQTYLVAGMLIAAELIVLSFVVYISRRKT